MGSAVALAVAARLEYAVEGVVLLAPMLAPAAPTWQRLLLRLLAATPLGRALLVPSAATANWQQVVGWRWW